MARRKIKEYNERRDEILAAAEQLFMTRGYDNTSVESIIEVVEISKGTFYYYFKSKEELLDALAYNRAEKAFTVIDNIVFNNDLNAPQRMQLYFQSSRSWKLENRKMLLPLIKMFYSPSNLLLREKMIQRNEEIARPTLTRIVRQGVDEGCFNTEYPEDIIGMLLLVFNSMADSYAKLLMNVAMDDGAIDGMYHLFNVHQDIFERILGAEKGSLPFVEKQHIEQFFGPEE